MAREERRISRRTAGRRSRTASSGRGDPRDTRRENQRLTKLDLDTDFLDIDAEGRVTLTFSTALSEAFARALGGEGLKRDASGKLTIDLGRSMGIDRDGRLAVDAGRQVGRIKDSSGGTVDPSGEVTGANADAVATLAARLNALLDALDTSA